MPSEAAIKAKHFGAAANTQRLVAMEAETYKTVNNVTNDKNDKNDKNEKKQKEQKEREKRKERHQRHQPQEHPQEDYGPPLSKCNTILIKFHIAIVSHT